MSQIKTHNKALVLTQTTLLFVCAAQFGRKNLTVNLYDGMKVEDTAEFAARMNRIKNKAF